MDFRLEASIREWKPKFVSGGRDFRVESGCGSQDYEELLGFVLNYKVTMKLENGNCYFSLIEKQIKICSFLFFFKIFKQSSNEKLIKLKCIIILLSALDCMDFNFFRFVSFLTIFMYVCAHLVDKKTEFHAFCLSLIYIV